MSKVTGAELKARVHALSSVAATILDMSYYLSIGDGQRAAGHRQPRRRDSRKSNRHANLHFLSRGPVKQEEFNVAAPRSRKSMWGKSPDWGTARTSRIHLREFIKMKCARRERPPRHAAEQRDELAAGHSITSSAVASSVGGTVRPSSLAVARLMTSSNFDACITNRSAGLAPLKMRPA